MLVCKFRKQTLNLADKKFSKTFQYTVINKKYINEETRWNKIPEFKEQKYYIIEILIYKKKIKWPYYVDTDR